MPMSPLYQGPDRSGTILRSDIQDVPPPCNSSQLLLGVPEASPGQTWCIIPSPNCGSAKEHFQVEVSRKQSDQMNHLSWLFSIGRPNGDGISDGQVKGLSKY